MNSNPKGPKGKTCDVGRTFFMEFMLCWVDVGASQMKILGAMVNKELSMRKIGVIFQECCVV